MDVLIKKKETKKKTRERIIEGLLVQRKKRSVSSSNENRTRVEWCLTFF